MGAVGPWSGEHRATFLPERQVHLTYPTPPPLGPEAPPILVHRELPELRAIISSQAHDIHLKFDLRCFVGRGRKWENEPFQGLKCVLIFFRPCLPSAPTCFSTGEYFLHCVGCALCEPKVG